MYRSNLLVAVFVTVLSGCVSIQHNPAQPSSHETKFSSGMDYTNLWSETLDFMASRNIGFETIDKEAGYIRTSSISQVPRTYFDCGSFYNTLTNEEITNQYMDRTGQLTVVYTNMNTDNVSLSVYLLGSFAAWTSDGYSSYQVTDSCYSTGELEKELFMHIEKLKQP